jgi:hypothetical protein
MRGAEYVLRKSSIRIQYTTQAPGTTRSGVLTFVRAFCNCATGGFLFAAVALSKEAMRLYSLGKDLFSLPVLSFFGDGASPSESLWRLVLDIAERARAAYDEPCNISRVFGLRKRPTCD